MAFTSLFCEIIIIFVCLLEVDHEELEDGIVITIDE
jgi:hypothetical protein